MFLETTPVDLAQIEGHAANPQLNLIAEYVHRMKSSASILGLRRLEGVYESFEMGLFGPAKMKEFSLALRQEFELAKKELIQFIYEGTESGGRGRN